VPEPTNQEIADIFFEIADILEIEGTQFKPRAYRRAAQSIETLPESIAKLNARGELDKIPGVGASIAEKIREILNTGHLAYLETLRAQIPKGLSRMMQIENIGPKTALKLYKDLKIQDIEELEKAAKQGRLRKLKGFSEKAEERILESIALHKSAQGRLILGHVLPLVDAVEKKLSGLKAVQKISVAGSVRRRKETIHDIDMIVASKEPGKVMDYFTQLPEVKKILAKGQTKSTVLLEGDIQADLRVVGKESYGAGLAYLTGSKEHNIRLRDIAIGKGMKLSEYGLFDRKTDKRIAGETEESVYKSLGLAYVEPELREDRGEIEAAQKGKLPELVEYSQIKGDLHTHTNWSEGANSLEEMGLAAKAMGHEYLAICDHSQALGIAHGMNERELVKQGKEIDKLNRKSEGFTLLKGVEANIGSDGKLDIKDKVLKDLDIVLASIHSGFKQPEKKITERVLSAMHNDNVNIIAHPTGRLINERPPYKIDLAQVFEEAAGLGQSMEINAFPDRTDLSDIDCMKAKEYGATFSIGTDAHDKSHLGYMRLGAATARRGWLGKKDVINTLRLKELRKQLR